MTSAPSAELSTREAVFDAWSALRAHLARRAAQLNDEVRRYPTPIARCDEQLPHLLEQRRRAVRHQRLAEEVETGMWAAPPADRLKRLAEFLATSDFVDDDDGELLRRQLADALAVAEANKRS